VKTYIDRSWVSQTRYVLVTWDDREANIVDNETGVVVYTTPSTPRSLERAIAFCRRHTYTIVRIDVSPVELPAGQVVR
jgi:hypothetical protein